MIGELFSVAVFAPVLSVKAVFVVSNFAPPITVIPPLAVSSPVSVVAPVTASVVPHTTAPLKSPLTEYIVLHRRPDVPQDAPLFERGIIGSLATSPHELFQNATHVPFALTPMSVPTRLGE